MDNYTLSLNFILCVIVMQFIICLFLLNCYKKELNETFAPSDINGISNENEISNIIKELRKTNFDLNQKRHVVNKNKCDEIKKAIEEANFVIEEIIKSDSGNYLCKYDLSTDVVNKNLQDSVTYTNEWQNNYNVILEWEDDSKDDQGRFLLLLKNVDLLVSKLNDYVCENNKLHLERLNFILQDINNTLCGMYTDIPNNKLQKETFDTIDYTPNYTFKYDINERIMDEMNFIRDRNLKVPNMHDGSFESLADEDIINNINPTHTISNVSNLQPYYTSRVNSCNGKVYMDDDDYKKNCSHYESVLFRALNGDPSGMLHNTY